MIKKQKINMKEFLKEASDAGCWCIRSSRSRCIAVDTAEIAVVTTEGAVRIPITQVREFLRDMNLAAGGACDMWSALSLEEKNQLAREQGMTYGKLEQIFYQLGGKHEREN